MKRLLILLIAVALLAIAYAVYRQFSLTDLNVDPHAREEIEKAKQR
jgi:hypothetical protein